MVDTAANIILNTSGGDTSASEIGKASSALQQITSSSSALQSNFQERFQHVGLQIFASQALGSIGLSGETRQAVMLMNTALIAGEGAAGIASGGMALLVTALVAVGAAVYEVITKHKDLIEVQAKLIESQQEALDATNKDAAAAQLYAETIGGSGGLLAAEQKLANLQQGELLSSEQKQIEAIQAQMEANISHAKVMSLLSDSYQLFVQNLQSSIKAVLEAIPGVGILVDTYELLKNKIGSVASSMHLGNIEYQTNASQAKKAANENALLQVQLEKLKLSIENGGKSWKDLAADADASGSKMTSDIDEVQKNWDKVVKDMEKTGLENEKAQEASAKKMADFFQKGATDIGNSMGQAFTQMIVTGESFTQAMDKMFEQLFEKILQEIITLIAEWAIFSAMAGLGSGSVAAAGVSGLAKLPSFMGGQAIGGSMLADTPTLAMFGEGGPEMATFTPMSGGGTSSGGAGSGGGNQSVAVTINVNGGMIDQNTLSKIGQYIVQTIRGQGQVAFT